MIRVKIVKPVKNHKVGDVVYLSRNEAFGLIDSGMAVISKDMTQVDYQTRKKKWPR